MAGALIAQSPTAEQLDERERAVRSVAALHAAGRFLRAHDRLDEELRWLVNPRALRQRGRGLTNPDARERLAATVAAALREVR